MNGYVLLVEDNMQVQKNNKQMLERFGYTVRLAGNLAEARTVIAEASPAAIVLDIMLPDGSGLDFLHELRQTSQIPVLLLTGLGTPLDTVAGLDAGGDDYLSKPYDLKVFRARVDALMRRAVLVPELVTKGPFQFDTMSLTAYMDGADMLLTSKELSLLMLFVKNEGKIMSAQYLYEKVWGRPVNEDIRTVKAQVSNLRKKLAGSGYTITPSRGEGYCFEME